MADTYTQTNAPLPWMEPYLRDYAARNQANSVTPYQQAPGNYVAPNAALQQSWQMAANRGTQGAPEMSAARGQLQKNINGDYLNSNPYINANVAAAQDDMARGYNMINKPAWDKRMQASGSFGNTGVAEAAQYERDGIIRNMGNLSAQMRGQNYTQERGIQQNSINAAPAFAAQDYTDINAVQNAGQQQQQYAQQFQQQQNQFFNDARDYPNQQLQRYGQGLGVSNTGTQSSSQQPGTSTAGQIIGGAATGIGLYNSLFGRGGVFGG